MILDKKEEKTGEATTERTVEASSTQQQQQPPSYSPTTELTSSPSLPSSSSSPFSSYPRDIKAPLASATPSTPPPLPYIFPPLYSPSPTSPFLLAYPPALAAQGVPEAIFLALVRSLNSSLKKSPSAQMARTAENLIGDVPGLNLAYGITKTILGGVFLGVAKGTAAIIEGGHPDGPASKRMEKISTAYWARPPTSLPRSTLSLLALANSPSGPFPPSSGLCLTIVPYSLLPAILEQYGPALEDVPADVARALMRVHSSGSSSSSQVQGGGGGAGKEGEKPGQEKNGMERKKALRVRGRIDFRRWGFVKLEGEDSVATATTYSFSALGDGSTDPARGPLGDPKSESAFVPTANTTTATTIGSSSSTIASSSTPPASSSAIKPTPSSSSSSSSPSRPTPAPTRSSSSGGGMFSHVDEKLAARKARRQIPVVSSTQSPQSEGGPAERPTGFTGATVAEGTWFLVLVKRGLEGMEEAPGLERRAVPGPGQGQGESGSGTGTETGTGVMGSGSRRSEGVV